MSSQPERQPSTMQMLIQSKLQAYAPAARRDARRTFEMEARSHLADFLARPNPESLAFLLKLIDRDLNAQGQPVQGRFGLAFMGKNAQFLQQQWETAGTVLHRLDQASAEEMPDLMAGALAQGTIKGAGPTFLSLVGYLKHPEAFAIWNRTMAAGLEVLHGRAFSLKTGADYRRYNEACQAIVRDCAVSSETLDIVLSVLGLEEEPAPEDPWGFSGTGFDAQTFELMAGLAEDPTASFYQAHKPAFLAKVQLPMQNLLLQVIQALPADIQAELVTDKKKLFSRILKNDYGQGGAWPWYWGALVPLGRQRTQAPQLHVTVQANGFSFGFSLSKGCSEDLARLKEQGLAMLAPLRAALVRIGLLPDLQFRPEAPEGLSPEARLEHWLANLLEPEPQVFIQFQPSQIQAHNAAALVSMIRDAFLALLPLLWIADGRAPGWPTEPAPATPDVDAEEPYSLEQCAKATGIPVADLQDWIQAIQRKKQAVLYGPPGTGKTYVSKEIARYLSGPGEGFIDLVQFHPAYTYEDFLQGIQPQACPGGGLEYPLVKGRFMQFCERAKASRGTCVLILDEMNRANLSQVFGELMYLLEYRDEAISLAAGGKFKIPGNVRILGTMNTADRSIALVDHALRRRFAFLHLPPNYGVLELFLQEQGQDASGLVRVLEEVNQAIGDPNFHLGVSFFLHKDLQREVASIWRTEIEPYLQEYFFNEPDKVEPLRWERVADRIGLF